MKTTIKTIIFLLGFSSIFALPEVDINTVRYRDYPEELRDAEYEKSKQFYAELKSSNPALFDILQERMSAYCAYKYGVLEEYTTYLKKINSGNGRYEDESENIVDFNNVDIVRCTFLQSMIAYTKKFFDIGLHIEANAEKMESTTKKTTLNYDTLGGNVNFIMPAIKNNNLEIIKFFACQTPLIQQWAEYEDGTQGFYERTLLMAATYGTIEAYIVARKCFFENASMFIAYDKYDGYAYPVSFAVDRWEPNELENRCMYYLDYAKSSSENTKEYYSRKYTFCKSGAFFEIRYRDRVPITQVEYNEMRAIKIWGGAKQE